MPVWLTSRFDRDGVAHALDAGALKRFLASGAPADWHKASSILRACLTFQWTSHAFGTTQIEEPVTAIDPYWLHEIVSHHAAEFGRLVGAESAAVFRDSIRAMFGHGSRVSWSYLIRPAVDDHAQNHGSRSAENCVVEGLRDALLSWCDVDASGAIDFTRDLLRDDLQILRRIGIFTVNERWTVMRALYLPVATPQLFQLAHVHELYHLLSTHFENFSIEEKEATLASIRALPLGPGDEADRFRRQLQLRWLSAIPAKTSEDAAAFSSELGSQTDIGVPDHPDFLSYMESSWGPGPTPYRVEDLVQFAERGEIVDRLNAFTPDQHSMRAATMDGLVASLEQAVIAAPAVFTHILC